MFDFRVYYSKDTCLSARPHGFSDLGIQVWQRKILGKELIYILYSLGCLLLLALIIYAIRMK